MRTLVEMIMKRNLKPAASHKGYSTSQMIVMAMMMMMVMMMMVMMNNHNDTDKGGTHIVGLEEEVLCKICAVHHVVHVVAACWKGWITMTPAPHMLENGHTVEESSESRIILRRISCQDICAILTSADFPHMRSGVFFGDALKCKISNTGEGRFATFQHPASAAS